MFSVRVTAAEEAYLRASYGSVYKGIRAMLAAKIPRGVQAQVNTGAHRHKRGEEIDERYVQGSRQVRYACVECKEPMAWT